MLLLTLRRSAATFSRISSHYCTFWQASSAESALGPLCATSAAAHRVGTLSTNSAATGQVQLSAAAQPPDPALSELQAICSNTLCLIRGRSTAALRRVVPQPTPPLRRPALLMECIKGFKAGFAAATQLSCSSIESARGAAGACRSSPACT
jgi:hypothetical protein